MAWFKVDDGLVDHRKVRRLGRDKTAAMGVWVLCGAWAASNLTDGFVPAEVVQRYDPREKLGTRLVECGLWTIAQHDGEPGYQFHDWFEHQPSREDVEKNRRDNAARQQRHRGRQRADAARNDDGTFASNAPGNALRNEGSKALRNGRLEAGSSDADPVQASGLVKVTEKRPISPGVGRQEAERGNAPRESVSSTNGECHGARNALLTPLVTQPPARPGPARKDGTTQLELDGRNPRNARVAELAGSAHTVAAHRLVEAYAATCNRRPPTKILSELGVEVDALLSDGWPDHDIDRALTAWGSKTLGPGALQAVAHEVVNRRPAAAARSTADDRVAAAQALKTQLSALPGGA